MLAKKHLLIQNYMYVGELCWWKFWCMLVKSIFNDEICMLVKDVGEKCMLVKLFHWNMHIGENFHQHAALTNSRKFYVGENHQNQIFDL